MPGPRTTLLIEGSFRELVEELADFVDNLKKTQADSSGSLKAELSPLLQNYADAETAQDEDQIEATRDDVLKVVVPGSAVLNSCSDKDFIPSYNLLIHLIRQSDNDNQYLQSVCQSLSRDLPSPSKHGLALTVLTTVFNTAEPDDSVRFNIFTAILDLISRSQSYDNLRTQLAHLDGWLSDWKTPPAQQRRLYLKVAQVAREAGEPEEAYDYLIRALSTVPSSETASEEARKMSIEALKMAVGSPTHFDFEDLTSLDSIQALRTSDVVFFELLDVFVASGLEDYLAFKEEHSGWIEQQGLEDDVLTRKIRLLTLASLASSGTTAQTRSLPYTAIAEGLQIPSEDVEMWVIDVIRAGLVEGKLSQSTQNFLIHRSTYRVFGETQWREVAGRLDMWRNSLIGVLAVIRQEKDSMVAQKEQESKAAEAKVNGLSGGGGYRRAIQRDVDMGLD